MTSRNTILANLLTHFILTLIYLRLRCKVYWGVSADAFENQRCSPLDMITLTQKSGCAIIAYSDFANIFKCYLITLLHLTTFARILMHRTIRVVYHEQSLADDAQDHSRFYGHKIYLLMLLKTRTTDH